VQRLDRTGGPDRRVDGDAMQARAFHHEKAANALAAARGITHALGDRTCRIRGEDIVEMGLNAARIGGEAVLHGVSRP